MSETGKLPPFTVNTEIIPAGVELELATRRNRLIEAWRQGDADAESTLRSLLSLYWTTQQSTNGETNCYLMDASVEFPVEAGIDPEVDSAIWRESQKNHC